jgi:hypothetical protein
LSESIREIGRQASESTRISTAAKKQAENVVVKVEELRSAAQQIGAVVGLINEIAGRTNLLALNATIEAARAGEAGKGFAVVASEVKSLATQTAKATEEITEQIEAIRATTLGAAEAIHGIADTVGRVNDIAIAIASAVVEQGAATEEITRSVELVSSSTASVAQSMTLVGDTVVANGEGAAGVKRTAEALSAESRTLGEEVTDFIESLKNLSDDRAMRSIDVDLHATVGVDGKDIAGRAVKLSPGSVLFVGVVKVTPGMLIDLRIEGIDRPLAARFAEPADGGVYLQLPLNHEHLAFMSGVLNQLDRAAAA